VLLAVALALRGIGAGLEVAFVEARGIRVLVVDMAVTLLLSRPADFVILAGRFTALPGARVSLLMFAEGC
jgi:hypothetical protein